MPISTNLRVNQKGLSVLIVIVGAVLILGIAGGVYFFNSKKDNPDQLFQRPADKLFPYSQTKTTKSSTPTAESNPASEYCIKVGGELQSQTRGDGEEYDICSFGNDKSCEEWALYRRNCPPEGVKTLGFGSPEEIYCALIGGKTTAEPDADCTLPGGKVCSNSDLYNGKCQ